MSNQYDKIYQMVKAIPSGQVATYGQIAKLLKMTNSARLIGYALSALSDENSIPWYRVVNAKGQISPRTKAGYDDYQRILLRDEGVEFKDNGLIDLKRFQWQPDE